jgi:uncharacterized membrane protein
MEHKMVDAQIVDRNCQYEEARRGQMCALLITLVAMAVGSYTAIQGHEWAGSAIGVGGVGAIVTTFVLGRSRGASSPQTRSGEPKKK